MFLTGLARCSWRRSTRTAENAGDKFCHSSARHTKGGETRHAIGGVRSVVLSALGGWARCRPPAAYRVRAMKEREKSSPNSGLRKHRHPTSGALPCRCCHDPWLPCWYDNQRGYSVRMENSFTPNMKDLSLTTVRRRTHARNDKQPTSPRTGMRTLPSSSFLRIRNGMTSQPLLGSPESRARRTGCCDTSGTHKNCLV